MPTSRSRISYSLPRSSRPTLRMGRGFVRRSLAPTRDVPAGTAVVVISLFRLRTTIPYLVPYVETPDPNIIMRHSTSKRTMTPAMAAQDRKLRATGWRKCQHAAAWWCGDLVESAEAGRSEARCIR